jgi:hypothetical protein
MTTTLDSFEICAWVISDGLLTVTANGEATISAWDPQDEVTCRVFDATCQIDLDSLEALPTSDEEVAQLVSDAEWDIPAD